MTGNQAVNRSGRRRGLWQQSLWRPPGYGCRYLREIAFHCFTEQALIACFPNAHRINRNLLWSSRQWHSRTACRLTSDGSGHLLYLASACPCWATGINFVAGPVIDVSYAKIRGEARGHVHVPRSCGVRSARNYGPLAFCRICNRSGATGDSISYFGGQTPCETSVVRVCHAVTVSISAPKADVTKPCTRSTRKRGCQCSVFRSCPVMAVILPLTVLQPRCDFD